MREFIRLLVLWAAAGTAYTLWRLYSYPGGWAYAFSPRYATDRNDLGSARRKVRVLAWEAKKELAAAHAHLGRTKAQHRARIRGIERQIDKLLRPGHGTLITQYGGLTLHQHTLIKEEREIPLTGLEVRLDHAQHQHFIHLTPADGDACYERYPRTEHEEDDVRRFAIQLENAVAEENAFRSRTAALITHKQDELAQAQADTQPQQDARKRLDETTERHRRDTRHHTARSEREAAHDRWQKLTGKRPR